jgi:uncharacterized protein (DUF1684 family)
MKRQCAHSRQIAVIPACLLALSIGHLAWPHPACAQAAVTAAESEWRQDLNTWRARRAQEIDSPTGWLTLSDLEWLKSGANSVGAAPDNQIQVHAEIPAHLGLFVVSGTTVQLLGLGGSFPDELTVDGKPAKDGPLVVDGPQPSVLGWRGVSIVVQNRGGRFALRIKDQDSPTRKAFHGLNWYPPDPQFSVEAHWTPYTPQQTQRIPTATGTPILLPAPGIAEFTLSGHKLALEPVLESPGSKTLFFILRDDTSKDATYDGARYLHAPFPDHGLDQPGKLILDFNRLENPPCAYTTYAQCPLPPEKNRLPIAIEAGEKRYTP